MEFKTSISGLTKDDTIIRGRKLSELMGSCSFSDAIFLILRGHEPTEVESKLFAAILVGIIDHGMGTTSSLTTRFVMSGGNPLNSAVAGGILALGDYHGGSIEKAMIQLQKLQGQDVPSFVRTALGNKTTLYGFGHKVYKEKDPRVTSLLKICQTLNYQSEYILIAQGIETTLEEEKGRKICLNIDGFIAAVLLQMGFSPNVGKGIFIAGRVPGLIAQALEEKEVEKPVRRLSEDEITYHSKE